MNRSPEADLPILWWNSPAARIGVSFPWHADRYAHRLEVIGRRGRSVCLASCEGAGDEFWPPSPALQQLNFQPDARGRACALLLGMAGKSHWSLSIEQDEAALVFDAACRLHQPPDWLGSRYRVLLPWHSGPGGRMHLRCEQADVEIIVETLPDDGLAGCQPGEDGLSISPLIEIKNLPATVRWRYQVRVGG